LSEDLQRKQLDLLASLNRERLEKDKVNPGLEGVIESYELAFRMEGRCRRSWTSRGKPKRLKRRTGSGSRDGQLRQAMPSRAAIRRSRVRFIEIGVGGWDQHRDLKAKLTTNCHSIDKPIAALLPTSSNATCSKIRWSSGWRIRPHARCAEQ